MPKGSFCKVNISNPVTGANKSLMIEDFRKSQTIHGLRMASEFDGAALGEEYAGCTFRITGGNDAQGFPMYQGVLKSQRARLLLKQGAKCYLHRRNGERKRRSVRGCIVGPDLHALSVVLVDAGDKTLPGLTDVVVPKRLVPKRASKIRRLFGLPTTKVDPKDQMLVCELIKELAHEVTLKNGEKKLKYPKVQRVVTDEKYARKQKTIAAKREIMRKSLEQLEEYKALLSRMGKEHNIRTYKPAKRTVE